MSALTFEAIPGFAGNLPTRGCYPIKAGVRIFKGALVGLDAAGRAMPADTIANGCLILVGKASATYDNRAGSALGGAAGAVDVDVEFGTFECGNSAAGDAITAAHVGKNCYGVDDQTVALTSNTLARPLAGTVIGLKGLKVLVYMGPHVVGALTPA